MLLTDVSSAMILKARRSALRVRAAAACDRCKRMKIKCSGFRPCVQCKKSCSSGQCSNPYFTALQQSQDRQIVFIHRDYPLSKLPLRSEFPFCLNTPFFPFRACRAVSRFILALSLITASNTNTSVTSQLQIQHQDVYNLGPPAIETQTSFAVDVKSGISPLNLASSSHDPMDGRASCHDGGDWTCPPRAWIDGCDAQLQPGP